MRAARSSRPYGVAGRSWGFERGALAASDPYQFQWWALGLVGARPAEGKKARTKASTAGSTSTKATPARRNRSSCRSRPGSCTRRTSAICVASWSARRPQSASCSDAGRTDEGHADGSGVGRVLQVAVGPASTAPDRHRGRTAGREAAGHAADPSNERHLQAGAEGLSKAAEQRDIFGAEDDPA